MHTDLPLPPRVSNSNSQEFILLYYFYSVVVKTYRNIDAYIIMHISVHFF